MTREETQKLLMAMTTAYPSFKIPNDRKTATVDLWTEMLSDISYPVAAEALKAFISIDTKGFAPSIGQIRAYAFRNQSNEIMEDGEAWDLVYNALCNSNYHAEEEFNKLPADVRSAVGGASTLRSWAAMDESAITVAESNFKRSYRAKVEQRKRDVCLPEEMRPQIGTAPVAMLPDKEERKSVERADNEKVSSMIDGLFEKWGMEI